MEIDVLSYDELPNSPSLEAALTISIRTPKLTLTVTGCSLHNRDGRRWVTWPPQRTGHALSTPIKIGNRNEQLRFQVAVLEAVDQYLATRDNTEVAA